MAEEEEEEVSKDVTKEPVKIVKQEDFTKIINDDEINIFEGLNINYRDVTISISAREDGVLTGRASDQVLLFCADILRSATDENSFEDSLEIQEALSETLKINYGWSDFDYNSFTKIFRRNLYLIKIGQDNRSEVNLKEYQEFQDYLEKKRQDEAGEASEAGDNSKSVKEQYADEQIAKDKLKKVDKKSKSK